MPILKTSFEMDYAEVGVLTSEYLQKSVFIEF